MAENANDPRTRQSGLDTPLSARRRRLCAPLAAFAACRPPQARYVETR